MRYSDTIANPSYHQDVDYRQHYTNHLGIGDSSVPEMQFANGGEATVAAFLLETLTSGTNPIARHIMERASSVLLRNEMGERHAEELLTLSDLEARETRRAVQEVAEYNPQLAFQLSNIPESVIKAAKQMHYGVDAHEIGSTQPTAEIPADLDLDKASTDLKTAVRDIAAIRKKAVESHDHGAPHSAEFAAEYVDRLIESIEHPIAA